MWNMYAICMKENKYTANSNYKLTIVSAIDIYKVRYHGKYHFSLWNDAPSLCRICSWLSFTRNTTSEPNPREADSAIL